MGKKVNVLISTYNGMEYIEEQLQSIYNQTYQNINIVVRDDGSKDGTIDYLKKIEKKGLIELHLGENVGPMRSFLELIKLAPSSQYYAFCDQDDIWKKNKIELNIKKLVKFGSDKPSLYFSKSTPIDNDYKIIEKEEKNYFKYSNVLQMGILRNICQGCTSVFNRSLAEYIINYEPIDIGMHDWWMYLICLSLQGNIVADDKSHLYYRQHDNNVLGSNPSLFNRLKRRAKLMLTKRKNTRVLMCEELLKRYSGQFEPEVIDTLKKVTLYKKSPKYFINLLTDKNFYSDSLEYNISFIISVLTFVF